jgi:hypothetical protein
VAARRLRRHDARGASGLAQKGHLASAVTTVVGRAPALTDDQKARIRAALHAAGR